MGRPRRGARGGATPERTVRAESQPGRGFRTVITPPLAQSIVRALVVDVAGEAYALPIARVERVLRLDRGAPRTLSGREYVELDGAQLGLVATARELELDDAATARDDSLTVIVISGVRER